MKKKKIIVLGAGMVGSAIALNLTADYDVTEADRSKESLQSLKAKGVKTKQADLSQKKKVQELVKGFDLVVGAVPGFMGFQTLKTIIEAKKNVVDIYFFQMRNIGL